MSASNGTARTCWRSCIKDSAGRLGNELLYRDREPPSKSLTAGRPGVSTATVASSAWSPRRTASAWPTLFDPLLAVHTSLVEPLPHQITAVYERLLPRQPLRFLLADDPGAGKTIMAGLFIKELIVRATCSGA